MTCLSIATAVLAVALLLSLARCATGLDAARADHHRVKAELKRALLVGASHEKRAEILKTAAAAWMLEAQRLRRVVRHDVDTPASDAFHRLFADRSPSA